MVANHFGYNEMTEMDIAIAMKAMTDLDAEGTLPDSANNFHEYGSDVTQLYEFFSSLEGFEVVESSFRTDYTNVDLIQADSGVTGANVGNLPETFLWSSLYASENIADTGAWVSDAKDSYFVKWLTGHLENNRPTMVEWAIRVVTGKQLSVMTTMVHLVSMMTSSFLQTHMIHQTIHKMATISIR